MTCYKQFPKKGNKREKSVSGETRAVTERGTLDVPWSPEFSQKESVNYTD